MAAPSGPSGSGASSASPSATDGSSTLSAAPGTSPDPAGGSSALLASLGLSCGSPGDAAPRLLSCGDAAVLLEWRSLDQILALFPVARDSRPPGVTDLIPAARTLLVRFRPDQIARPVVCAWLHRCLAQVPEPTSTPVQPQPQPTSGRLVEIPVHYVGEDLDAVADWLGLTRREVVERHTGSVYQAAFAGFAPGFVYLAGGDPCFGGVPRRPSPRTRVPAGSVALAGGFSAVYPSESPGGWQLLGVTPVRMWDLHRAEPALIQPGFQVRFIDLDDPAVRVSLPASGAVERRLAQPGARGTLTAGRAMAEQDAAGRDAAGRDAVEQSAVEQGAAAPSAAARNTAGRGAACLEVLRAGAQTLFQDLGRPGLAGLGVSRSGALDRAAARQANQLVGNPPGLAVLENALGGLRLSCHGRAVVAVTGAQAPVFLTTASGVRLPAAAGHALRLEDGQVLRIGAPRAGVRCYVAVRGGWAVPPVLGSCATDVLAGIGPAPVRPGDRLEIGAPDASPGSGSSGDARSDTPAGVVVDSTAASGAPLCPPAAPGLTADGQREGRTSDNHCVQAQTQSLGWAQRQPQRTAPLPQPGDVVTVEVIPGPRDDWFAPEALALLAAQAWRVTPQSNRVGMRLAGARPLRRSNDQELPSEGAVAGAIQVPTDGQPVLFLADHPLTGGYPVIAVVRSRDIDRLAQVPVGAFLRFHVCA
ncbi:urea amidolyase family protein [Castellaniella caeni]|uniref:5-oxoprolinase subunit B/C family protein n=1 Tax=Castellaniella caeni TaxID=266123 RepID=UPI000AA7BD06|nr:urea amidolyase family protein [Castellaniella caeni]